MIQMLKYFWVIKLCSMFINVKLCRKCSENDKLLTFKKKKNWNSKFLLGFEFRCTGIIRNTTDIDIFSSLIFYKYWGVNIALSPIVLWWIMKLTQNVIISLRLPWIYHSLKSSDISPYNFYSGRLNFLQHSDLRYVPSVIGNICSHDRRHSSKV